MRWEYHKDGTAAGYLRRPPVGCSFSTDAHLKGIHAHDRSAFDLIADLERKLKLTMRPGASPMQIIEARSSAKRGNRASAFELAICSHQPLSYPNLYPP